MGLICALIFALWSTPIVVPLKVLTVLLHELSHAAIAILTGGSVESLSIDPQQGGQVISRGGNRFLTLSAGYLGSLVVGVALFLAAVRTKWDRTVMAIMGGIIFVAVALYVRDLFALVFCIGTGGLMIAAARYMPREVNDLGLRVIGLTSMIYVPFDIFSDTLARSYLRSDARMLSEEIGGPTMFWGGLWLIASLCVIAACLRFGLGDDSNILRRRPKGS
ncbi:Peptidase M50B-like [Shimia gijangensis]|uniref:Peptidase M50B-like n=1 Tax=Shimia gijangensis TaxID=1470563 RepID=A0A1M6D6A8_9RHOB|nr:M50 family metallopeptidase [Shimia gijangensis]SHI68747.1 Peptidase M50B-like [Shimia gijangensis]